MEDNQITIVLENINGQLNAGEISARSLFEILSDFEVAVESIQERPIGDSSPALSMPVEFRKGSIKLSFYVGNWAKAGLSTVLTAINTSDFSGLPEKSHTKLISFSKHISELGLIANITDSSGTHAEVSAYKPILPARLTHIKSTTTIYGEVVYVGGESSPSATLKIFKTNKQLKVKLPNKTLATELASRLYDHVGLKGEAVFEYETGNIVSFEAFALTSYKGKKADPASLFIVSCKSLSA